MKKIMTALALTALVLPVFAIDDLGTTEAAEDVEFPEAEKTTVEESAAWPVFFAFSEIPETPDLVGLRLTIPFATKQDNVTGIDLGFWGSCHYFEGIQLNLIRNKVIDSMGGIQIGLYNSVDRGNLMGFQIGLWNEANSFRGFQVGLINLTGQGEGFQVGLINRAEDLRGYQVGLINVIRAADLQVLPIINIGF